MNPRYPSVALRARHHCEYCGAPESMFNFPFEVELIQALAQGGEDSETNMALFDKIKEFEFLHKLYKNQIR